MSGRLPALRHSPTLNTQLSPTILTPSDTLHPDTFNFPKQPIVPFVRDDHSDEGVSENSHKPVSLLTTLLHSPGNQLARHYSAGPSISSARSSTPSTAISSPNGGHGILQKVSILRRGSAGSDGHEGVGLGVMGLEGLVGKLERVEEKRERIGWADEPIAPVQRTPSVNRLKFAVASRPSQAASDSATSRRPSSPFAKERLLQRDMDSGEDASPGVEEDFDEGYEEDEEDGTFSDDEDYAAKIPRGPSPSDFPFARSTNYRRRRNVSSTLAPSRGRVEAPKTVTRHCSPPPQSIEARARSGSPSRLSDAGPRANRAGSPMPSRVLSSDEESEADPARTMRHVSAPPVFEEDEGMSSVTDGVRNLLRRTSEHIPGLRPIRDTDSQIDAAGERHSGLGRSLSRVTFDAPISRRQSAVGVQPMRCAVRRDEGEELGWTSDALWAVRRTAGKAL